MEHLEQNYPQAAEHLRQVPEHVADHLGQTSLRLTHEAMHPVEVIDSEYGPPQERIKFDEVITSADFDRSQLDKDAVEAAEKGQQKLAETLTAGARAIGEGHQALLDAGHEFGPKQLETDQERNDREAREKREIYKASLEILLERAKAAKQAGDTEQSTKELETFFLVRFTEKAGELRIGESRQALRDVAAAGLGDELLKALQESKKIFYDRKYHKITLDLYESRHLFMLATGKKLDDEFRPIKDLEPEDTRDWRLILDEDVRDVFSQMTTEGSWLTPENGFQILKDLRLTEIIKKALVANAKPGEPGSLEYMSKIIEREVDVSDVEQVLRAREPIEVLDVREKLGIPTHYIIRMFGRHELADDPVTVDMQAVDGMLAIKEKYPDAFEKIWTNAYQLTKSGENGGIPYDPEKVLSLLDMVSPVGLDSQDMLDIILESDSIEALSSRVGDLLSLCNELKINPAELPDIIGESLVRFKDILEAEDSQELKKLLVDAQTQAQISKVYRQAIAELEFPLVKREIRPDTEELWQLTDRVEALGIPQGVAKAMVESWMTYSGFDHYYYYDSGFHLPTEMPPPGEINAVIIKQQEALTAQVKAFETFVEEFGMDQASEIIEKFGIYNFSRHSPEDLALQLKRWNSGVPIENIIVDARADWNSFNGKGASIKDETAEGTFHFEVNSGTEAARVAVMAGRREREQGREPNVRRFIIHAHGNETGLLVGVNGEEITTQEYARAARGSSKIDANEVNDYKRHLGKNFEVILQSCSTAGEAYLSKNIAKTMGERHDVTVNGYSETIHGLVIEEDGTVRFLTSEGDGEPVVYKND